MQHTVNGALIARRVVVVMIIIAMIALLAGLSGSQTPMATHIAASWHRIVTVALAASTDLFSLALLCLAAGVLVLLDRRRRTKVRQASA